MNCEKIKELFSEYHDGELAEAVDVAAHLSGCEACAREYEFFRKMIEDIQNLPVPTPPSGFHDMLMGRVRQERRKRRGFFMPYLTAAASIVLLIGLWATFLPMQDTAIEPPSYNGYEAGQPEYPIPIMRLDMPIAIIHNEPDQEDSRINWLPPAIATIGLLGIGVSIVIARPWGFAKSSKD